MVAQGFSPALMAPGLRTIAGMRSARFVSGIVYGILVVVCACAAAPSAYAQQEPEATPVAGTPAASQDSQVSPDGAASAAPDQPSVPDSVGTGKTGSRIFGVLPNYTTVEGATEIDPLPVGRKFQLFARQSFDPSVFPYLAVVSALGNGQGTSGYLTRYELALADNTLGNFMTNAYVPVLFHQDPRYFEKGQGGRWQRAGYALSRIAVTRGDAGRREINVSEIGGNLLAAGVANVYYPTRDRSVTNTLSRWGTQLAGDALSLELKEFWPDIHRKFSKRARS
jgi:hypothetical protein